MLIRNARENIPISKTANLQVLQRLFFEKQGIFVNRLFRTLFLYMFREKTELHFKAKLLCIAMQYKLSHENE